MDGNPTEAMVPGPLILVIEDDIQIRRFLSSLLTNNLYRFIETSNAREGITQVQLHFPDLIILDLGLPDMDGIAVIRHLREWTSIPILVLTARGKEQDMISALDAGADDYLTKPFATGVLLARIRVALRHAFRDASGGEESPLFEVDGFRMDLSRRQVIVDDHEVHLTPIEYKLLSVLVHYAGKVVTQRQLLKEVWGPNFVTEGHYVRIYMARIRHKIEPDAARPHYLITEPGVGYRFKADI